MKQYKVGDKVTIRSWESMEREFGSCIAVPGMFIDEMREMCGKTTRISSVVCDGRYTIADGYDYHYAPQMFTDWETDNTKETKMQYNGQEVELITEGYWPEGVTLICSEDGIDWLEIKAICLHDGICLCADRNDGDSSRQWKYWALLPAKPAPRRLTNREVAKRCRAGWDILAISTIFQTHYYYKGLEDDPAGDSISALRAPNSDEWLEPTSDLLERADKALKALDLVDGGK